MALLFMDSFDHYTTSQITRKWTSGTGTIGATGGRHGSSGVTAALSLYRTLTTSGATAVAGMAFRPGLADTTTFCRFGLGGVFLTQTHVSLRALTSGAIAAFRHDTVLLGSSVVGLVSAGTIVYIEFLLTISNTVGVVQVRIDGAPVLSLSGIDTRGDFLASDTWDTFSIGNAGSFDDVYVLDGSGSTHNTFLGDTRVELLRPDGAGAAADWTPSPSVPNWQNLDETTADDDTTYNFSDTVGAQDIVSLEDVPSGHTVLGAQLLTLPRKTDVAFTEVTPIARQSAVNFLGAPLALSTSYLYTRDVYQTAPDSSPWSAGLINTMEFGYRKTG